MRLRRIVFGGGWIWGLLAAGCAGPSASPSMSLDRWVVEQMPGGHVSLRDGTLVIEDAAGCTVWWREELRAPVEIQYDVTVIARGGPHDRVSDVNCFWMAMDPRTPGVRPAGRSGKFEDYDSLRTYYVGMGGNENTTTRFRRYAGDGTKPLLSGYDRREKEVLLEPNRTYRIRLVVRGAEVEFWRDGHRIFAFTDPAPLARGWFGIRTVQSHLEIRNLAFRSGAALR